MRRAGLRVVVAGPVGSLLTTERLNTVAGRRVRVGGGVGAAQGGPYRRLRGGIVKRRVIAKRRVVAVLAAVVAGLALFAVPAADWDGHGNIERNEWNIPLTNLRVL